MLKKRFLFFVVLVIWVVHLKASISVIESNSRRLAFSFNIGDFSLTSQSVDNRKISYLSYSGATTELLLKDKYKIPATAISIGVPPSGQVLVSFVSLEVKRYFLNDPLPLSDDDKKSDDLKEVSPSFTNPWISDIVFTRYRDLRTARLFIKPFLYNAQTKTLTVLVKGTCIITFPTGSFATEQVKRQQNEYYDVLKYVLLNYPVAKNWLAKRDLIRSHSRQSFPILPHERMLRFEIGDGHRESNETMTKEKGILRITGTKISLLSSSPVPINKVTLYGSYKKELDQTAPAIDSLPSGITKIPVLRFDQNNNGWFDDDDYVLAYVTGISDWSFDSTLKEFKFDLHSYDTSRHYWLAKVHDDQAMERYFSNAIPQKTLTTFTNHLQYKKSNHLRWNGKEPYGGLDWAWRRLTGSDNSYSQVLTFPDALISSAGIMKIAGTRRITGNCSLSISMGLNTFSTLNEWTPFFSWGDSLIQFTIHNYEKDNYFQLEHIDVKYTRPLSMSGKSRLEVFSPHDSGVIISYLLSDVPQERMVIVRLSQDESSIMLVADTVCPTGTFSFTDTAGLGIRYFISTESGFLTSIPFTQYDPKENNSYEINNPRIGINQADYLIITQADLKLQAIRLAQHKEEYGNFNYPKVIEVSTILREFSGGNFDPGAIRNFLMYSYHSPSWRQDPFYVLFLGNGNYDYKGYRTNEINHIPTAQIGDKCLEDFFSCLNPGENVIDDVVSPDLFLGRITCNTPSEAQTVIDKIVEMEGPDADYGAWRNRVLLVSDDDMQGPKEDGIVHYYGNEEIEDSLVKNRPYMDIRKIYLFDYEFNEVYEKPEAARALITEINNGVSCVNYFGHGSHNAWADEYILEQDKIGNFANSNRYPVINSFSCSVGRFDNPDKTCLSGVLVNAPRSGGIAAISSARIAWASQNTRMAKIFYDMLYKKGESPSLGQAYYLTKAFTSGNLKNYVFLGDPSIRFYHITDSIDLTILDQDNNPINPDSLSALEIVIVKGTVLRNNVINTSFGSSDSVYVQIGFYNPDQDSVKRKDGVTFTDPIYSMPGAPLFAGITQVKNGVFSQKIPIPRRVTFKKPDVSLTAYAWDVTDVRNRLIAVGAKTNMQFTKSKPQPNNNQEGPRIAVRPIYDVDSLWNTPVGFTDKISSFLPLTIEINVWDEDGLDTYGIGPNEGLTLEIKNVIECKNINHKFIYDAGEYTKGYANESFAQNELKPGTYDLIIGAQDNFGNQSKAAITLEILAEEDFKLGHVFNYPNPVLMGTRTKFYFYHANTSHKWHGSVNASIKIFTLSGKLIRFIRNARNGEEWDLTDQRGRRLSPNVYLYRIFAQMDKTDISGRNTLVKSPIRKLVIHPSP